MAHIKHAPLVILLHQHPDRVFQNPASACTLRVARLTLKGTMSAPSLTRWSISRSDWQSDLPIYKITSGLQYVYCHSSHLEASPALTGFSRKPASACTSGWAAYAERYDVGSITDAVVNGDGGFHTPAIMKSVWAMIVETGLKLSKIGI